MPGALLLARRVYQERDREGGRPIRKLRSILTPMVLAISLAAIGPIAAATPLETQLEAELIARAGERYGLDLRSDPALREAARELTVVRAAGADIDPHEFLRAAESAHGVLDPFPYVLLGEATPKRLATLPDDLLAALGRMPLEERRLYTHVAVALLETGERRPAIFGPRVCFATLLLTQRAISFSPLPDDLQAGERFLFDGEIHAPFREPQVFVTWPDGASEELTNLALEPGHFRCWIRLERGDGEYQIEVLGRNDMGPRVLGLGSLMVNAAGRATPHAMILAAARTGSLEIRRAARPESSTVMTVDGAESRLLTLLNRDRRHAGLAELCIDPALAQMARAHSRDMCEHRFFAHVSPKTGRLLERAQAVGVRFQRLAENIATHTDVDEAEAALLRSPGHRKNILDADFTRVGIGVAFATDADGQRRVYVTQNFMTPMP